jgi:glycerol-3-phosphate acyltransferase PlsY
MVSFIMGHSNPSFSGFKYGTGFELGHGQMISSGTLATLGMVLMVDMIPALVRSGMCG